MNSSSFVRYAVVLVVGVLIGSGFGLLLEDSPDETNVTSAPLAHPPNQIALPATELATPRSSIDSVKQPFAEQSDSKRAVLESEEQPLISERLLNYARAQIRLGWQKVRPQDSIPPSQEEQAIQKFEKVVLLTPEVLGRTAAEDQDELEIALANGAGFALIERMLKSKAGEESTLISNDSEAMQVFFEPETSGPTLSGFEFDEKSILADGTTLVFPPGVYRVNFRHQPDPFPRNLTIHGAGIDQTLLFAETIHTRSILKNLAIKNCTVFAEGGNLIDLRREPCSLYFENARFLGFDSGAGGSDLLDAVSGVVLARNCIFDGRYGRSPGHHTSIFDVRSDGLLARFENCEFNMVNIEAYLYRPGARVVFDGCRFNETPDRQPVESQANLSFPGTTIEYYDWKLGNPESRDLNELFPDWKARRDQ